jgi:hypothetical protein
MALNTTRKANRKMASRQTLEAGIGASFRYLADQHLEKPGKINEYAVKDHFTRTTQSAQWGSVGQQLARMLNNPPHHDDTQPIRELVGKMGFNHAIASLADGEGSSHEIHRQYEAIERARQRAFEPIAALIDSSEWAHENKEEFYKDAYRVADMIHALHVDESQQHEVSAEEARKMSVVELRNYQSSVPIGAPAEMISLNLRKWGENVVRWGRKKVGDGKQGFTENFTGLDSDLPPMLLWSNKNKLTAKVYLDKWQFRQVVFSDQNADGATFASATATNEGSNQYKVPEKIREQFGIAAYYFERNAISRFFPRDIQYMHINGRISVTNRITGTVDRTFKAKDWTYSSLGYFEDYLSEYPLGQACIWELEGSSADEQTKISVTAGSNVTLSATVYNYFQHEIYKFQAGTNNFRGDRLVGDEMIGDEWTMSQNNYRSTASVSTDPNDPSSPMRSLWKDGKVRVFQLDLSKTKPVGGPSMLGEAGDYKIITPRLLLFCRYLANQKTHGQASRRHDVISFLYAALLIPTITRMNHKVARINR